MCKNDNSICYGINWLMCISAYVYAIMWLYFTSDGMHATRIKRTGYSDFMSM